MMELNENKLLVFDRAAAADNELFGRLKQEGFELVHIDNLEDAAERIRAEKPAGVLINVDTCGSDSWSVVRELKQNLETRRIAIILYSGYDDEANIVRGFEEGADDYIVRPTASRATVARIKGIVRRVRELGSRRIKVKDLEIDLDEHRVYKAGKPIDLTYTQFKLLYLLASHRENVFTRQEILERVWGKKVYVTSRTVDVHIKRLREKLGEQKYPSKYIETIHGTGYRFM
ncbi:MAG: response regulator transcription factor [candidate division KSB1 bacterium]|nr:response regulator transcription factor [candidate division KSB1 bacterium]